MIATPLIVTTTDFSKLSLVGVRYAAMLAAKLGGSVTIVHAFDSEPLVPMGMHAGSTAEQFLKEQGLEEKIIEALQGLADELAGQVPQVKPQLLIGHNAARTIARYAKEHKADMLVVSSHGRSGVGRIMLGSVAEQLVRLAPCPVLTIPVTEDA